MKRFANILLVMTLTVVALYGCEKKKCWKCEYKFFTDVPGEEGVTTDTTLNVCDMTEEQAKNYAESHTGQTASGNTKITKTMNCGK